MNETKKYADLSRMQYHVTRENGTEPAFRNAYWDNKEAGIYVDIVSGEPLFCSVHQFSSGTGWPSFFRPLKDRNVKLKEDFSHGMKRVEVRSAGADSHLGHVFNDGPEPTGLRYCINSAALRFIPVTEMEAEGYGEWLGLFRTGETEKSEEEFAEYAVLGGGCFWCLEAIYKRIPGVLRVVSGYAGGKTENPEYRDVSSGRTGHAEVVRIEFDSRRITYAEILDLFWKAHDPTTLNRQGADEGTQYRSIILYDTPAQERIAAESVANHGYRFTNPIVTEIIPLESFYPAENYHQDYFDQNRRNSYCKIVIEPKLKKLNLPLEQKPAAGPQG